MTKSVYRNDNFYLILRGNHYHAMGTVDGKRVRRACKTRNIETAKRFLETFKIEMESGWRDIYDCDDRTIGNRSLKSSAMFH